MHVERLITILSVQLSISAATAEIQQPNKGRKQNLTQHQGDLLMATCPNFKSRPSHLWGEYICEILEAEIVLLSNSLCQIILNESNREYCEKGDAEHYTPYVDGQGA